MSRTGPGGTAYDSIHGVKVGVPDAPSGYPILLEPCFHVRDRNNHQTVHLEPQSPNACYARLHLRQCWLSLEINVEPTRGSKSHQTRYGFGNYTEYPFFLPGGTSPALVDEGGPHGPITGFGLEENHHGLHAYRRPR